MIKALGAASAVCLVASACGGSDEPAGLAYVGSEDVGDDPFTTDVAESVPTELAEARGDAVEAANQAQAALGDDPSLANVRRVRLDAATTVAERNGLSVIAPSSERGVGLYGGSGVNACDVDGLIGFLSTDAAKAEAWATVHGISVAEIESYLRSLTPGFLIDDTEVVNHTFTDGAAVAIPSTLEAGTAVLVDNQGIPRVRCKCGNPLFRPDSDVSTDDLSGLWEGDWGRMALRQTSDGEFRGVYDHDEGTITGSYTAGRFVGWWCESPSRLDGDAGPVEFVFSLDSDQLMLDGRWDYATSVERAWSENWDLARVSAELPDDLIELLDLDENFCSGP